MQAPSVTVASIQVIEVGLLEQRFLFKLRLQNPNDLDISVKGVSFEVKINDEPFARGVSDKPITLPRLSEAVVDVSAVSDLSSLLRQIRALQEGNKRSASYHIKGRLFTGMPIDVHFENSGVVNLPVPPEK
jgi:LEA14-like dessication related protein